MRSYKWEFYIQLVGPDPESFFLRVVMKYKKIGIGNKIKCSIANLLPRNFQAPFSKPFTTPFTTLRVVNTTCSTYVCKIATTWYLFLDKLIDFRMLLPYCYKLQYLFKAVRFCRVRKFPFGHRKNRRFEEGKTNCTCPITMA